MRSKCLVLLGLLSCVLLNGQSEDSLRHVQEYGENIQKSYINGVYIPKDMAEAFSELDRLTSRESKLQFLQMDEIYAARSLFFSLGRWITIKWQFYEGSRFSHYLKIAGLKHPDDMAFFVMILYHRHLKKAPLDVKNLIDQINNKTLFPNKKK